MPPVDRLTEGEHIDSRRQKISGDLTSRLSELRDQLLHGAVGCNFGCRSVLLGSLMQALHKSGLNQPAPEADIATSSLMVAIANLRAAHSSSHFSSEKDSLESECSGVWTMEHSPSSKVFPKTKKSSGLFGAPVSDVEVPRRLVLHHCTLKRHLDPILEKVEAKIKGLELSDNRC